MVETLISHVLDKYRRRNISDTWPSQFVVCREKFMMIEIVNYDRWLHDIDSKYPAIVGGLSLLASPTTRA